MKKDRVVSLQKTVMEKKPIKGLKISKGTKSVSPVNKAFKRRKKQVLNTADYLQGIRSGNRVILSRAITLVESKSPKHQAQAQAIIEACLPYSGNSIRIGITGTPGVGKSTFIEQFGGLLIQKKHKVAVLAVDPSSQISHGSILGDKTRMYGLSTNPAAFIRPTPTGDSLGGVARKTRESIILCEAAGFDRVIIETVGVGQSETAVHSMVDFFLLLLLPNSGDELQGIKRGVMEMADLIAINKADGAAIPAAKLARRQCQNGLHLFPPKPSEWIARAVTCSALKADGLDKIEETLTTFETQTKLNGYFEEHRKQQSTYWLEEQVNFQLQQLFHLHPNVKANFSRLKSAVLANQCTPFQAAEQLIQLFK